ncbi:hypothetical protein [Streptomyces rubellomurinus]|uniref:DUF2771 domain-containing protein n=2 Tax=Streptomyces TaxID=1883 RepID=A0A0F2TJZ3_STRR3|nr:hypothetical protein [Streptomyces rubellomurinus]KJS55133.1 hypothetical protein VM98_14970 [Streptomyces rubellomurinus subsp. indigoferus]KJS63454.1 hypothetical protein VM95_02760 [Streptomyces rubellomurinus]
MSLNPRVIAALGAVVVVGAGTVGGSIAVASDKQEMNDHRVTLTVGRSSSAHDPFCYNDGKPLSDADQEKCLADANKASKDGTLPGSDVKLSDRVGIGVSPQVADQGWMALSNGGGATGSRQFLISAYSKTSTFSGLHPAGSVLNNNGQPTVITVFEGEKGLENPTAIWYFQLNPQDS